MLDWVTYEWFVKQCKNTVDCKRMHAVNWTFVEQAKKLKAETTRELNKKFKVYLCCLLHYLSNVTDVTPWMLVSAFRKNRPWPDLKDSHVHLKECLLVCMVMHGGLCTICIELIIREVNASIVNLRDLVACDFGIDVKPTMSIMC